MINWDKISLTKKRREKRRGGLMETAAVRLMSADRQGLNLGRPRTKLRTRAMGGWGGGGGGGVVVVWGGGGGGGGGGGVVGEKKKVSSLLRKGG